VVFRKIFRIFTLKYLNHSQPLKVVQRVLKQNSCAGLHVSDK